MGSLFKEGINGNLLTEEEPGPADLLSGLCLCWLSLRRICLAPVGGEAVTQGWEQWGLVTALPFAAEMVFAAAAAAP